MREANAHDETPETHTEKVVTLLKKEFLDILLPIYERLSNEDLLQRCSQCVDEVTQNANESLHQVIWNKCRKEVFVSKTRVELATIFRITEFNFSCRETVVQMQKDLGMSIGLKSIIHA